MVYRRVLRTVTKYDAQQYSYSTAAVYEYELFHMYIGPEAWRARYLQGGISPFFFDKHQRRPLRLACKRIRQTQQAVVAYSAQRVQGNSKHRRQSLIYSSNPTVSHLTTGANVRQAFYLPYTILGNTHELTKRCLHIIPKQASTLLIVYPQVCISLSVPRTFGAGPLTAWPRAIFGEYHCACTAVTFED